MPRRTKRKILSFAFLSFFVVVAFLLAEANFIVFSALKNIFEIPYRQSFLLAMILTFFSGGFILMLILEKYFGNYLVRLFYLLTSIWMGAFVYVFISSAAYVFISLFFNIPNYVGLVLFLLALGVSLYGISHGRKILHRRPRARRASDRRPRRAGEERPERAPHLARPHAKWPHRRADHLPSQ